MADKRRMPARSKLTKRASNFRKAVRANGGKHVVSRAAKPKARVREAISGASYDPATGKVTYTGVKTFPRRRGSGRARPR